MLPSNHGGGTPTYDLELVQQLVGQGEFSCLISSAALMSAERLGFSRDEVIETVLSLAPENFYKTMEAIRCPGLWQDVYHIVDRGVSLYIKLQVDPDGFAVVIQFKRK